MGSTPSKRKQNLGKEFENLDNELEVAQYATTRNGQYRKKVPRKQSGARTKKRKLLEASDREQLAIDGSSMKKRLRGSRAALEDDVVDGSAVFHGKNHDDDNDDDEDFYECNEEEEDGDDEEQDGGDEDDENDDDKDDDDYVVGPREEAVLEGQEEPAKAVVVHDETTTTTMPTSSTRRRRKTGRGSAKKRRMYRMRSFRSQRMAQRHGDALGAHARGVPRVALEKLNQVAADAPSAPQVYSSLGMVYEDLLTRAKRKSQQQQEQEQGALKELLELSGKAYGSYHAAAVLCKRDFSLWVRSADTSMEIANLHARAMAGSRNDPDQMERHRAERKRWIEEAQRDYLLADNLKPPGIDVPAKLAAVQMELGNLSEAITILTDLKNRPAPPSPNGSSFRERNEFESSHKSWLLYAELMLRIGHECTQWNKGIRTNENYMFKRWMRKYSTVFDWQERRLQALSLALEAAAGSEPCQDLVAWSRRRVKRQTEKEARLEASRWHMDAYETTTAATNENNAGAADSRDKQSNDRTNDTVKAAMEKISFERDRSLMIEKHKEEMKEFDSETARLQLSEGSAEETARLLDREKLLSQHKSRLVDFVGRYLQGKAGRRRDQSTQVVSRPLPTAASCASVCSIASVLMKHCLGLEHYEGGRLVGECVAAYFRLRAAMRKRRAEKIAAFEEQQRSTAENVLLRHETYDEVSPFLSPLPWE